MCRSELCVPGWLLYRYSLWSEQPFLDWRQPSLRLQEWKKRAINTRSSIPVGLHTLPFLEALLTVVFACSVLLWPSLHPAQVPPLCATFLFKRAFSEDPQFSALKRPVPFSSPVPENLLCLWRGKKHVVQEHGFSGDDLETRSSTAPIAKALLNHGEFNGS